MKKLIFILTTAICAFSFSRDYTPATYQSNPLITEKMEQLKENIYLGKSGNLDAETNDLGVVTNWSLGRVPDYGDSVKIGTGAVTTISKGTCVASEINFYLCNIDGGTFTGVANLITTAVYTNNSPVFKSPVFGYNTVNIYGGTFEDTVIVYSGYVSSGVFKEELVNYGQSGSALLYPTVYGVATLYGTTYSGIFSNTVVNYGTCASGTYTRIANFGTVSNACTVTVTNKNMWN